MFSPSDDNTGHNDDVTTHHDGQDKPPPVLILDPPLPPSSPTKYAYVKDIKRCMEESNYMENSTDDDEQ